MIGSEGRKAIGLGFDGIRVLIIEMMISLGREGRGD